MHGKNGRGDLELSRGDKRPTGLAACGLHRLVSIADPTTKIKTYLCRALVNRTAQKWSWPLSFSGYPADILNHELSPSGNVTFVVLYFALNQNSYRETNEKKKQRENWATSSLGTIGPARLGSTCSPLPIYAKEAHY